jgi:hypothetical protein
MKGRVQLRRQLGIINGADNNFDVLDVLTVGALPQFGEGLLVDVFSDNATAGHHGPRNAHGVETFASTDIRDNGTGPRIEKSQEVVDAMKAFKFGV